MSSQLAGAKTAPRVSHKPVAERTRTFVEAVREATDQEMARDPNVVLFGLDVDDPKAIQGTTLGLPEKYGAGRVFGTPLSEDAMTGAAIGMALAGLRPIHVHIRMDFLLLAVNQLLNVAAKSRYMYGGRVNVPLVVNLNAVPQQTGLPPPKAAVPYRFPSLASNSVALGEPPVENPKAVYRTVSAPLGVMVKIVPYPSPPADVVP